MTLTPEPTHELSRPPVSDVAARPSAIRHRWVVLVAAGSPSLGAAHGDVYRRRLARLLAASAAVPPARTFAVVHELESPWWTPVLAHLPATNVVDQPFDRGTATGVALALVMILDRDPSAEVVVATLGADPETVSQYVEDAAPTLAESERSLLCAVNRRELVSCVGSLAAWMRLFHRAQPELLAAMVALARDAASAALQPLLDAAYPFLAALDLGRDVLGLSPNESGDRMRYSV